jgi:hypothetical protein
MAVFFLLSFAGGIAFAEEGATPEEVYQLILKTFRAVMILLFW